MLLAPPPMPAFDGEETHPPNVPRQHEEQCMRIHLGGGHGGFQIATWVEPTTDDDEEDHTGLAMWPASTLVIGLLHQRYAAGAFESTDVLDLGCGTGIAGVAAAVCLCPRRVVLSDQSRLARALAQRNAALQSFPAFEIADYGWRQGDPRPLAPGGFGLILASDVLYADMDAMRSFAKFGVHANDGQALARFVALLDYCLAPGGTVLIGLPLRNSEDQLRILDALSAGSFRHQVLDPQHCLPAELYALSGACHDAIVLRCHRVGEAAQHGP